MSRAPSCARASPSAAGGGGLAAAADDGSGAMQLRGVVGSSPIGGGGIAAAGRRQQAERGGNVGALQHALTLRGPVHHIHLITWHRGSRVCSAGASGSRAGRRRAGRRRPAAAASPPAVPASAGQAQFRQERAGSRLGPAGVAPHAPARHPADVIAERHLWEESKGGRSMERARQQAAGQQAGNVALCLCALCPSSHPSPPT